MSDITFTIRGQNQVTVTPEDAVKYVIDFLRNPRRHSYPDYGYDLYLNTMLTIYCQEKYGLNVQFSEDTKKIISPLFMDACWELCRRGMLRPFPHDIYGQGTSQGAGFSATAFGKQWLQEKEFDDYVPTEPERFAELLAPYRDHFGAGFYERAQKRSGVTALTLIWRVVRCVVQRQSRLPLPRQSQRVAMKSRC